MLLRGRNDEQDNSSSCPNGFNSRERGSEIHTQTHTDTYIHIHKVTKEKNSKYLFLMKEMNKKQREKVIQSGGILLNSIIGNAL